ncbi:MAG: flagellar hook basal-body protein [Planctomycetaceae bacterium]
MGKSRGSTLWVAIVCIATVAAHAWLNARHEHQLAGLLRSGTDLVPLAVQALEQPLGPEIGVRPSLLELLPVNFEADAPLAELPADALQMSPRKSRSQTKTAMTNQPSRQQLEDEAAVREVIEEEMSETSAEERDIWFEELKSIPAEAVRDMLQVRKQLRLLTPDHQLGGPGQLAEEEREESVVNERSVSVERAAQTSTPSSGDWRETRQALQRAIDWSLHNAANAVTPGYKRTRVLLGDAYLLAEVGGVGAGCRIRSVQIDLQPGEIVPTGRELDLAIAGEGFFTVRHEKSGRVFYTRCGAWTLDDGRRLCQTISGEKYLLDPPVAVPVSASVLQISSDGAISSQLPAQEQSSVIGRVSIVRFAAPAELFPAGNSLFFAPNGIEPLPDLETAANGVLKQFALEQSNVNLTQEQQERTAWESILQTLPSADIPRTAQQAEHLPR